MASRTENQGMDARRKYKLHPTHKHKVKKSLTHIISLNIDIASGNVWGKVTFKQVEQGQNRGYHIDYKMDPHSTYLILDLWVKEEFAESVTWYRGPIQLFFTTYIETKHTLLLPLSF